MIKRARSVYWVDEIQALYSEIARLRARADRLEAAIRDAIECIEDWGAYAPEYFKEKWDLKGDLARLRAALEDK